MRQIISMATSELSPYCDEFIENHRQYAAAQGYEYVLHQEKHPRFLDLHPFYSKLGFQHDALEAGAERVVWVDADVAFMDCTWDIASLLDGGQVNVGRWGDGQPQPHLERSPGYWLAGYCQANWPSSYLCFGLLVFRNNWLSRAFLREVERRGRENPEVDYARNQYYGYNALAEINNGGVRMCKPEEIGCFSVEACWDGQPWRPGCPTVHIAGISWERRRQLFHDHYRPLVKAARE